MDSPKKTVSVQARKKAVLSAKQRKLPAALQSAIARKKGVSLSNSGRADIELGKDGSKWKHGYIPENPAAVALKMHRKPGDSSKMRSTDGASARASAARKGGFSLNKNGNSPKDGYMVSYANDKGGVEHVVDGQVNANHIRRHAAAASAKLANPQNYQGAWKDEDSGKTYLDVSKNVKSLDEAHSMAVAHKQLAIYDVKNNKAIKTSSLNRSAGQKARRAAENSNVLQTKKEVSDAAAQRKAREDILNYGKSPSELNGKDFRSMSGADKVRAAELMHGTGSKQHLAAKKKFASAASGRTDAQWKAAGYTKDASGSWVSTPARSAKVKKVEDKVNKGAVSDEEKFKGMMASASSATPLAKKAAASLPVTSVGQAVAQYGADRSKWSKAVLRIAARLGDSQAAQMLTSKLGVTVTKKK